MYGVMHAEVVPETSPSGKNDPETKCFGNVGARGNRYISLAFVRPS